MFFIVIDAGYWAAQSLSGVAVDYAGVTILAALGFATALMSYILIAGSPRD